MLLVGLMQRKSLSVTDSNVEMRRWSDEDGYLWQGKVNEGVATPCWRQPEDALFAGCSVIMQGTTYLYCRLSYSSERWLVS